MELNKAEITILGGGITGLLTSLSLAHHGIKSCIIDPRPSFRSLNSVLDYRNIAITRDSREFLELLGIWQKISNHIAQVKDIYVVDNRSDEMLHLSSELSSIRSLGHMIQSYLLLDVLIDLVHENQLITIKDNTYYFDSFETERDDGNLEVVLKIAEYKEGVKYESEFRSDLILACDGMLSNLKSKYFTLFASKDYQQTALVFNVRHLKKHEFTAVEHFTVNGPFAILPLPDQNKSSVVWCTKPEFAQMYTKVENSEKFLFDLQANFGPFLGSIELITEVMTFPIVAQLVNEYYYKNIALIGDAAHVIHPLAGQGLNQGIKDVIAISEIINSYKNLGLELDFEVLQKYQQQRKWNNIMMFGITDSLDQIFSNSNFLLSKIRRIGLSSLNKIDLIKKFIINS